MSDMLPVPRTSHAQQGSNTLKHWTHLSERQLAALPSETVAILPLGAVEAHGPHLPSGTDTLIAEGIVDAAATQIGDETSVLRLPTLWLGASVEHTERAGTLSTPAEALLQQIDDVVASVVQLGITRIVLFSAHGGNNPVARVAAMTARSLHGALCAAVHWMDFGLPAGFDVPSPTRSDTHGGWMETSIMMALTPELVQAPLPPQTAKAAPAPFLYPDGPVHWGWMSDDLGGDGFIGTPALASPELGDALVAHAGLSLATLAQQLSDARWPLAS